MTDKDIIKALECCSEPAGKCCCEVCPLHHREDSCTTALIKKAVELVKRKDEKINGLIAGQETLQKHLAEKNAEIEKKNTEIDILIRKKGTLRDEISELKAEVERYRRGIENIIRKNGG